MLANAMPRKSSSSKFLTKFDKNTAKLFVQKSQQLKLVQWGKMPPVVSNTANS
jgi:hypothetical protein